LRLNVPSHNNTVRKYVQDHISVKIIFLVEQVNFFEAYFCYWKQGGVMPYPTGHRVMGDRVLADELRAACMSVALNLGGWNKRESRKSKNGKLKRSRTLRAT
jgi:hypothetical protein